MNPVPVRTGGRPAGQSARQQHLLPAQAPPQPHPSQIDKTGIPMFSYRSKPSSSSPQAIRTSGLKLNMQSVR